MLRVEGNELEVATLEGDILLTGCLDAVGRPINSMVVAGMVLQVLDEESGVQLGQRAVDLISAEDYRRRVHHSVSPVAFPCPRNLTESSYASRNLVRVALPSTAGLS